MLILPNDEGEPLGRRNDVSNEVSIPSGNTIERTDGEGCRIDDSYEKSVAVAHACGLGGTIEDDVCVKVVGETDEIERDEDGTLAREIAGVDPGSVEGVEAETIATDVGVTTDVDSNVDGDSEDKRLKLISSSSLTGGSVGGGMCNEVGVGTSLSIVDGLKGDGVGDNEGEREGEGGGGNEGEGESDGELTGGAAGSTLGVGGNGGEGDAESEGAERTEWTEGTESTEGIEDTGVSEGTEGGDAIG